MSVGVELSDEDLEAVRILFRVRWAAEIMNWKERDTDYCMWFVRCPDEIGYLQVETGQSLAKTIHKLLERIM